MHTHGCIMYARGDYMPLLQVRDCPEDIYKKVTIAAKRKNRSIGQQIIALLEKGLGQEQPNVERRKQVLERIRARKIADEIKKVDAVALIREDRDR
jgi:hypothetical protein